jgi:anion-transporting  ArsA/GET3 family ATPase
LIEALVDHSRVLVCVGPGGVGKTTIAAAVGARAARRGKRTLVCTIDPAPRLADALGTGGLGADPKPLPPDACRALGVEDGGHGGLHAVRIDTAATFERMVREAVADREMQRRIFDNTIYRQITTMLTGSQEFAATLALHDFVASGRFDLVVLDTPPTANALDFLEAPGRIAAAVSSPALGWFARPPEGARRFSLQRLRSGGALLVRRIAKLVGSRFLDDVGAFLLDFQQVLTAFLARARAVDALLRGPGVGFLLVMVPEVAAVDEALYFHERLRAAGIGLAGFIANRVHAAPGLDDAAAIGAALRAAPATAALPATTIDDASVRLAPVARPFGALAASERRELGRLARLAPGIDITEVPLLDHDVDNLSELRVVGEHLSRYSAGEHPLT